MNLDSHERDIYEAKLKWFRTEAAALKKAEEKGLVKGIEQGKKEQAIRTAIHLLAAGADLQTIATSTGLTLKEIQEL